MKRMTKPCVITRLMGGLGNQMFQYAAGRALSVRFGLELKLDISWYDDMSGCTPRRFLLGIFPLSATFATEQECRRLIWREESCIAEVFRKISNRPKIHAATYFNEPCALGTLTLNASKGAYLYGYWQSEEYFVAIADVVRKDFDFPALPSGASEDMLQAIESVPDSTAVHIRRGDYVWDATTNATHGVCSQHYYSVALSLVASQARTPHLFLFSDDTEWVRGHFDTCGLSATVVDLHSSDAGHHDMHLMSRCKHHVIANSSFSWWGAWLSTKSGFVCAPKRWFATSRKENISPIPDRWTAI